MPTPRSISREEQELHTHSGERVRVAVVLPPAVTACSLTVYGIVRPAAGRRQTVTRLIRVDTTRAPHRGTWSGSGAAPPASPAPPASSAVLASSSKRPPVATEHLGADRLHHVLGQDAANHAPTPGRGTGRKERRARRLLRAAEEGPAGRVAEARRNDDRHSGIAALNRLGQPRARGQRRRRGVARRSRDDRVEIELRSSSTIATGTLAASPSQRRRRRSTQRTTAMAIGATKPMITARRSVKNSRRSLRTIATARHHHQSRRLLPVIVRNTDLERDARTTILGALGHPGLQAGQRITATTRPWSMIDDAVGEPLGFFHVVRRVESALPRRFSASRLSKIALRLCGSTPTVGSSSSSTSGRARGPRRGSGGASCRR